MSAARQISPITEGAPARSDNHMTDLVVTIQNQTFPHLLYHFVLTYSNWETGTICFSESFESLCEGFQTRSGNVLESPRDPPS